jgi:hypothetical protein
MAHVELRDETSTEDQARQPLEITVEPSFGEYHKQYPDLFQPHLIIQELKEISKMAVPVALTGAVQVTEFVEKCQCILSTTPKNGSDLLCCTSKQKNNSLYLKAWTSYMNLHQIPHVVIDNLLE